MVSMSSSEWISVSLSAIGFLYAFLVSWIFYRAQQKTDFRSLVERLLELKTDAEKHQKINEYGVHRSISGVDKLNDMISQFSEKIVVINSNISEFQREVKDVSKKIDAANLELFLGSLDGLQERIISGMEDQVFRDLTKIQKEIRQDIEKSSKEINDLLAQKLSKNIENRDDLIKDLTESMKEVALSATSKINTFSVNLDLRESRAISSKANQSTPSSQKEKFSQE